jgi:hypothetical protein
MAIREGSSKNARLAHLVLSGQETAGLELDFDRIVAGWDSEKQEKMANKGRKH